MLLLDPLGTAVKDFFSYVKLSSKAEIEAKFFKLNMVGE